MGGRYTLAVLVAACCLAGAGAFRHVTLGSPALRTPRSGLASARVAPPRLPRFRRAGAAVAMAAGDDEAVAKAKAAVQRAEQSLFGNQDGGAAAKGVELPDGGLLRIVARPLP